MKPATPASPLRNFVDSLKPEGLFLVLACSFGLAALFVNPPFQAPDENDHYTRVFQLSEGTLIGDKRAEKSGGELPRAAVEVTNTQGIPFHPEKKMTSSLFKRLMHPLRIDWGRAPRTYHSFPHTVVYSPAAYLPQILAVFLGRCLGIGPLGLMYLARLAGFVASVALGFAALRILPIYRWTFLVLLLCPMSLYLFGSVASDGMLITGAALLMARLARFATQRDRPARLQEQAIVLMLAGLLAMAKPVYLPLAGVALVLIFPHLGSRRSKALYGFATVVCCVVPVLMWGRVAAALFVPGKGDTPLDPVAQAHHILGSPFSFLWLVARTIHEQYLYNYQWMVGTLGWGDTAMPDWFYWTFGCGILLCLVLESGGARNVGRGPRIVMIAAGVISVLLIYAAQYASWNPPGSVDPIEGIEGRYFLPLAPLFILGFPAISLASPRWLVAALASGLSVLCGVIGLWALIFRYYVPMPLSARSAGTARLTQISTQAMVGTGANQLLTGLVIGGHGLETLLIRAEGLDLAKSGPSGGPIRPSLAVLDSKGTVLASNTGWETNSSPRQIPIVSAAVGVPILAPNSTDSALIVSLPEGKYTIEVSGADGATGSAQEEIFELSSRGTRLTNISSRAYVGKGDDIMIVRFVVGESGREAILGRVDGPALTQFGVTGVLSQPTLDISPIPSGDLIITSWITGPSQPDITLASSKVGAFPLAEDSADSAVLVSVPPGKYTMKVYGVGGATGVALAEIYEVR